MIAALLSRRDFLITSTAAAGGGMAISILARDPPGLRARAQVRSKWVHG